MAEERTKRIPPAYVAFPTFYQFLINMKKTAIPPRIDRSVLTTMSGANQNQLLSALRFLGLLDHNDDVQEPLRGLVAAVETPEWPTALSNVITAAYKDILEGLSMKAGTAKQLRDQFKDRAGVEADMADRCLRFFIRAIDSAKMEHSPHFKKAATTATRKLQVRKPRNGGETPAAEDGETPEFGNNSTKRTEIDTSEMVVIPIPFKGRMAGQLVAPKNLSNDDMKVVELAVQMLQAYASQSSN